MSVVTLVVAIIKCSSYSPSERDYVTFIYLIDHKCLKLQHIQNDVDFVKIPLIITGGSIILHEQNVYFDRKECTDKKALVPIPNSSKERLIGVEFVNLFILGM